MNASRENFVGEIRRAVPTAVLAFALGAALFGWSLDHHGVMSYLVGGLGVIAAASFPYPVCEGLDARAILQAYDSGTHNPDRKSFKFTERSTARYGAGAMYALWIALAALPLVTGFAFAKAL